ncbi:hypothetical protein L226DRAFT_533305 [Lentinus tigrinus ALCF2SS1-7]|uniref:uncharacterized protein n=1 Tax=Lentinus tigrinus ALCF2SS1-7 TaxID=1328758 RepID=UPI001166161A|nr:hypothetical protein L226DRAFT_533305 [Lentinus tigrinus ALCF2SS1-7]
MTYRRSICDILPDLIHDIVPYLNPEYCDTKEETVCARYVLLRCALTCKDFTTPALNVLWRSLPSDKPLVNLLSTLGVVQSLIAERGDLNGVAEYRSQDDPRTHPQWEHFKGRVSQVHAITLDPFSTRPSVWTKLVPLLRGEPVLPALRRVVLGHQSTGLTFQYMDGLHYGHHVHGCGVLQLITPSVRHLSLLVRAMRRRSATLPVREVLREACTLAPDLESLYISSFIGVSLEALQNHRRLRTVDIEYNDVPDYGLEPLCNLPHLESLSLVVNTASTAPLTMNYVRVLVLRGFLIDTEAFLDRVRLPQLRSLCIAAAEEHPAHLIQHSANTFRVLSNKYAHLTELRVEWRKSTAVQDRGPVPTLAGALCAVIEPLHELHELRDATLHFHGFCFAYSSSDIQSLAESWPSLESFHLEFVTLEQRRAGFESLLHFARNCPRLRALRLPDMELTKDAFDEIAYPKKPHPLRELNVARVTFPEGNDLSWEMIQLAQRVFPHAGSPVSV